MTTPSLHDIANMPLSQTAVAMRKFYDPNWGKEVSEKGQYRVCFNWSIEGSYDDTVEADSPKEAVEIAEEQARDEAGCYDGTFETSSAKVEAL